jgi:putative ABC transport system permease protein
MRAIVAILLRLFPVPFRDRYGADLAATFEDRWRDRPGWRLALRTVADLLRSAAMERLSQLRRHPGYASIYPVHKGDSFMTTLWQDLRFGIRTLTKVPGFTIAAVATLALGIGANSAIYSVVDAVLLKGLPYPHSDRLVFINESLPNAPAINVSWPDFQDWRAQNRVFAEIAVFQPDRAGFAAPDGAKSVPAGWVSASFFPLLGAKPILGRVFGTPDDRPGAEPVAVLSYRFWRNELKGDPQIVGKQIALDSGATVAGVLGPEFQFQPFEFDVYMPIGLRSREPGFTDRGNHPGLIAMAALQPDTTLARARADMRTIMDRLARAYPESDRNEGAILVPIAERLIGHFRAELLMLLGAVAFVLLMACANVAHLMLARAAGRQREFAIRAAIGASRGRLVRQLFLESALLALAGGAAGLLLAHWCLPPLVALYPGEIPGLRDAGLDSNVFLFTLAVSLAASALFGLAPMLQSARAGLSASLKEGGSGVSRPAGRLRAVLFVVEIATAIVLTVGATLLLRSLTAVLGVNPGFAADHLLALDIVHSGGPMTRHLQFFEQAADRIARLPGVESASAVMCPPLGGTCWTSPYALVGHAAPPVMQRPWTALNMVLPGYFATMRAKLIEGRLFTAQDDGRAGNLAIVNQTMARRLWPNGGAVGQRVDVTYAAGEVLEVVGVVADVKQFGLDSPVMEEVYVPAAQMPVNFMTLVVRTRRAPSTLMHAAVGGIQSLDRGQPVARIAAMTDSISASVSRRKFAAFLLGLFSALALLLALVGVAGVMAYTVAQRTREFGIRMAMGAQPAQVSRLVLGQALRLTALGMAIGLCASWALTQLLAGMLFKVKPRDPLTFAAVAALLAVIALAACLAPARRAARVHPMTALRYD